MAQTISTGYFKGRVVQAALHHAAVLLLAVGGLGCVARDPLVVWQSKLARYIAEEGRGDASVLRDLPDLRTSYDERPARITFGALDIAGPGVPPFRTMTDVQGVLVGVEAGATQPWYCFLVGVMDRPPDGQRLLSDVRLVGVRVNGRKLKTQVSSRDETALQQYVAGVAERPQGEGSAGFFPTTWDDFEFAAAAGTVRVVEPHSQAAWSLTLPKERASRALADQAVP